MESSDRDFLQRVRSISHQLKKVENKVPALKGINKLVEKTVYLSAEAARFSSAVSGVSYVQGAFVTPDGVFRATRNSDGNETYEFVRKLSFMEKRRLRGLSENFTILTEKLTQLQLPGDKYEKRKLIPGEFRARLYSMILNAKSAYKELEKRDESGMYVKLPPFSFVLRTSLKNSMRLFIESLSKELKEVLDDIEEQKRYGFLTLSTGEKKDISKLKEILKFFIDGEYYFDEIRPRESARLLVFATLLLWLLTLVPTKQISQGEFIGNVVLCLTFIFGNMGYSRRRKRQLIRGD